MARLFAGSRRDQSEALTLVERATQDAALISSPGEALNVFDFEPVARARIPVAHWGYLMSGTDDDATIRANRDGFSRYALRARRLVDVSRIDPSIEMLGVRWGTPIVLDGGVRRGTDIFKAVAAWNPRLSVPFPP